MWAIFAFVMTLLVWDFCRSDYQESPNWKKAVYRVIITIFPIWWMLPITTPLAWAVFSFVIVCVIADVVINYNFGAGLVVFLLGHIGMIAFAIVMYGFNPLLLAFGIAIAILQYSTYDKMKDTKMRLPVFIYLLGISIAVLIFIPVNPLLAIGYMIFMASDIILANDKFLKPYKHVFVANSIVYYLGLTIMVLAVI